jgi:hypothetical protein
MTLLFLLSAVFHTAGTVALADVFMAVSIERVQQQVRAVFQSILPASLDDCDADTLYLTLRLHQKKVIVLQSAYFLSICRAAVCITAAHISFKH